MNTHIIPNAVALVYNGVQISQTGEELCLTDMWKAANAPRHKEPYNWERKEGAAFIDAVALAHNLPVGQVIRKRRGKGGATYAHWQIGIAYAKSLDHDFHMWCNTQVRAVMEGKHSAALPSEVLEQIERSFGIMRMSIGKITSIENTVQTLAATVAAMATMIQPPGDGIYVTGQTAGQIWKSHGFPGIKVTSWFSNRLVKMGCQLPDGRRMPYGVSRAKLFDPDKAALWLQNGGKALVDQYIKEKMGQKRLTLVSPQRPTASQTMEGA